MDMEPLCIVEPHANGNGNGTGGSHDDDVTAEHYHARYEASRERHGIAVGLLSEGRCSACRVGLPSVKVLVKMAEPA